MYDLSSESRLVSGEGEIDKNGGYLSKYIDFFKEGTELCDYYGVELYLGRPVTPKDADNFSFLRQLMTGGALDTGPIHGTLEKRGGEILFRDDVWSGTPHHLKLDHPGRRLSVLDTPIDTGPFSLIVEVRLREPHVLRQQWESAPEGALVQCIWEPVGPASIVREAARQPE